MARARSIEDFAVAKPSRASWLVLLAIWAALVAVNLALPHRQSPTNPVPWQVVVFFGCALVVVGPFVWLQRRRIAIEDGTQGAAVPAVRSADCSTSITARRMTAIIAMKATALTPSTLRSALRSRFAVNANQNHNRASCVTTNGQMPKLEVIAGALSMLDRTAPIANPISARA